MPTGIGPSNNLLINWIPLLPLLLQRRNVSPSRIEDTFNAHTQTRSITHTDISSIPFLVTSVYTLLIEVNPLCGHVTFHPFLLGTASLFRSVQLTCHQTGQEERGGAVDGDADRHGEKAQGRNRRREAAGLLSDKKAHATERWGERNRAGVFTHLHSLYSFIYIYFLTSSPPDVLLQPLGFTGTSGVAVY